MEQAGTADARVGSTIAGKYRLLRVIGIGGMGPVFEAENTWTERRVALKLMLSRAVPDESRVKRFLREARAASKVQHPNIVDVLDMGRDDSDGSLFIAHELLVGHDLRRALTERGVFTPAEAIEIIAPVMSGLITAHHVGIVHRDIKPENIFLAKSATGTVTPKVIDFGIAKDVGSGIATSLTRTGAPIGTPKYMSPEQARGDRAIDHLSDIWSVGAVLYEMLSGRPLWAADNFNKLLFAIVGAPITRIETVNPAVPAGVAEVVHRALQREREKRFQSMRQFLGDLLKAASFGDAAWSSALRTRYKSVLDANDDASSAYESATGVRAGHSARPPAADPLPADENAATVLAGAGDIRSSSRPARPPRGRLVLLGIVVGAAVVSIAYLSTRGGDPTLPADLPVVTASPPHIASHDIDGLLAHGTELRLRGQNEAALAEFRRAYDGSHRPIARARMGLTSQALGRWIEAARDLRGAMASRQDPAVQVILAEIEAAYRLVREHIAVVEVQSGTPGAEVWINGDRIGSLPLDDALHLLPGTVALEVRAQGFTSTTRQIAIAAGETRTLMVELAPAAH